ncbi:battenin isoform X3 [Stigmatopora argus]
MGVIFASTSSGFGELSFLSLTVFYKREVLAAWGSGTGGAGVAAALLYSGLAQVGISPQVTLLTMLIVPFTMLNSYFFLLVPPPSFPQWKRRESDDGIDTSEERERLMNGSQEEQETCNQVIEDRSSGLLTLSEKLHVFKGLMPFIAALGLVYYAEYFINQGLMELLYFRKFFLSHAEQYRCPLMNAELDPLQFAYRPGIGVEDATTYLMHRSLSHLENTGSTLRMMFFDLSSAFNTIQPVLLRGKLEEAGVRNHLAAWIIDFLTDRPQYVRLQDCTSDVVACSTGAPQGTVLSPLLFSLYTSDFKHNTDTCHLQKFSDDTAIVGRVTDGNDLEYRGVITAFVDWCRQNHLYINNSKTKEMVIDFQMNPQQTTQVNIQGTDIEIVENFKYLGVHLNNKLDWSTNIDALYKRGQSRLYLLRSLRSFRVCRTLLRTFYNTVVASTVFYAVLCWGCGSTERDRNRLNKLVRRASSVLGCPRDSVEEVGERRMLTRMMSIMDSTSHPLHESVESLQSSFSNRLRHPHCRKERFRRSFLPSAVRLFNKKWLSVKTYRMHACTFMCIYVYMC